MGSGKKWVGASTLLSTLSVRMILTENGKKLIVAYTKYFISVS